MAWQEILTFHWLENISWCQDINCIMCIKGPTWPFSQHQYLRVLTEIFCLWRVTYSDESAQAILYHFPGPQASLHHPHLPFYINIQRKGFLKFSHNAGHFVSWMELPQSCAKILICIIPFVFFCSVFSGRLVYVSQEKSPLAVVAGSCGSYRAGLYCCHISQWLWPTAPQGAS